MPVAPATSTGDMLTRKRRMLRLLAVAMACEQSTGLPPLRMVSVVSPAMRRARVASAGLSSGVAVAVISAPSTSIFPGSPVWKAMSEAPRSAAQTRNSSRRSAGKA